MKFNGFIYGLKNPTNEEVFYIGCTQHSLKERWQCHYYNVNEVETGRRLTNDRLDYLKKLLPIKCEIFLIEEVDEEDMYKKEIEWIKFYRDLGYNLVNGTDGGRGVSTVSYYNTEKRKLLGLKISLGNSGVKRTEGYKRNLSVQRKGELNTMVGKGVYKDFVAYDGDNLVQMFRFQFEIDYFFQTKHSAGSIVATFRNNKRHHKPLGYTWKLFEELSEEEKVKALQSYVIFKELKDKDIR